jgi:hypothetical protein
MPSPVALPAPSPPRRRGSRGGVPQRWPWNARFREHDDDSITYATFATGYLSHHLEDETTVAIDGALHETGYFQPIRPGYEIFFIPKLEGG